VTVVVALVTVLVDIIVAKAVVVAIAVEYGTTASGLTIVVAFSVSQQARAAWFWLQQKA
jgi:hypothetical protein